MGKARALPLLVAAAAAGVATGADAATSYVTPEDLRVAGLASKELDRYCHGQGFQGKSRLNQAGASRDLERSLGGQNIALEVLKRAKSPDDVQGTFLRDFGVKWVFERCMPLVLAFVTLIVCCTFYGIRRCKCCAYEQPTRQSRKNCACAVIVLTLVGIIICTVTSVNGYWTSKVGLENTQCTFARLLDHTVHGDTNENFVGLFPLLGKLKDMQSTLDPGSAFMQGAQSILNASAGIERSADLVKVTLELLKDTLVANTKVVTSAGKPTWHQCLLCEATYPIVASALQKLEDSVAMKLGRAHADVLAQMQGSGRDQLRKNLQSTVDEFVSLKDAAVRGISTMFDNGWLKTLRDRENLISWPLLVAVVVISLSACLLAFCASTSIYRFTFHEMDPVLDEAGEENPYNRKIHRNARSAWCWGFCYVFMVLLVAGAIFTLAVPFSGFCLLLETLDGPTLAKIGPALNLSATSDSGQMAQDFLNKCIRGKQGSVNTFLLDILLTNQGSTVHQQLKNIGDDAVRSQFASIVQNLGGAAPPLASSPEMQAVEQALKLNGADGMFVGNYTWVVADDDYADMKTDPRLSGVVASSAACASFTVSAGLGNLSGQTFPGIQALADSLKQFGAAATSDTCAKKVECYSSIALNKKAGLPDDNTQGYYQNQACKAANRYMDLKTEIISKPIFRCDMFKDPGSTGFCDPLTGDCLDANNGATPLKQTCTLAEFKDYMGKWPDRLAKVLQVLDQQVVAGQQGMQQQLTTLIGVHIDNAADAITSSVTCNFMSSYYEEFLDGFCYQGVYGARAVAKSYIWCAVLAALLTATMYAVWCRTKHNVDLWHPDRTAYKALLQKEQERRDAWLGKKTPQGEAAVWINKPGANNQVVAPAFTGPPITERLEDNSEADEESS